MVETPGARSRISLHICSASVLQVLLLNPEQGIKKCIPVLPEVFTNATRFSRSQYSLTAMAVSINFEAAFTWSSPEGSRSIAIKSGISGVATRLFQGLTSIHPRLIIQSNVASLLQTR